MSNPKISIITITYNSEKTLEETIKSVISQNYDNIEYLIIDGGSKDKTLDIVERYRDNISFVISEPDCGISDAFNKGIRNATGDVIGIINSDDILCENALNTISLAYDQKIDVYRGQCIIWDDIKNRERVDVPTIDYSVYKLKKHVCHPSTFIRLSAYKKWGAYNTNLKYMMDDDILCRMYQKGANFKYIDAPLAKFRLGGATSQSWRSKTKEKLYVLRENGCPLIISYMLVFSFIVRQYIKSMLKG